MFDVGLRYVIYLAGSFSFASLIGMLSVFVPSGLGVREGILIFMLSQIMPVEVAIIISVSARLWFTATELVSIGVASAVRHPRVRESVTSASRGLAADELRGDGKETADDR
jgi:uncharacterized membrane protein YbhN (UPF0104 family)